jgi:hypothetical protein
MFYERQQGYKLAPTPPLVRLATPTIEKANPLHILSSSFSLLSFSLDSRAHEKGLE